MAFLSEAAVEQALMEQLGGLGYSIEREEDIGPDGQRPERESHDGSCSRGASRTPFRV